EQRRVRVPPPQVLECLDRVQAWLGPIRQQLRDIRIREHFGGGRSPHRACRGSLPVPPSTQDVDRVPWRHEHRQPPNCPPAHLEITRQALLVRGVEDEVYVTTQSVQRLERELSKDATALVL